MIAVSWGEQTHAENEALSLAIELCPLRRIIREVGVKHQVPYLQMVGRRRHRSIAWPRQEAYWRCYEETGASLPEIGRAFGGRDHTTILDGVRRYKKRMLLNDISSLSTDCRNEKQG